MADLPVYNDPDMYIPGERLSKGISVFLFGAPGTWKTSWAGTWPKPLFLSVGQEGGDDALALLPAIYGIQAPRVYPIGSARMMKDKIERIKRDYLAMDVNTIVVDSITYYADMWISELMELRYRDPKMRERIERAGGEASTMTRADWGLLAMHIRDLAMKLHSTPLNVIWIALEREIREQGDQSGGRVIGVEPFIKGESYIKLPGMCKMIIHACKELIVDAKTVGRMQAKPVYYTSPNQQSKLIRHKYGMAFPQGKLVDPKLGDIPTFGAIWENVGKFVYYT